MHDTADQPEARVTLWGGRWAEEYFLIPHEDGRPGSRAEPVVDHHCIRCGRPGYIICPNH